MSFPTKEWHDRGSGKEPTPIDANAQNDLEKRIKDAFDESNTHNYKLVYEGQGKMQRDVTDSVTVVKELTIDVADKATKNLLLVSFAIDVEVTSNNCWVAITVDDKDVVVYACNGKEHVGVAFPHEVTSGEHIVKLEVRKGNAPSYTIYDFPGSTLSAIQL